MTKGINDLLDSIASLTIFSCNVCSGETRSGSVFAKGMWKNKIYCLCPRCGALAKKLLGDDAQYAVADPVVRGNVWLPEALIKGISADMRSALEQSE